MSINNRWVDGNCFFTARRYASAVRYVLSSCVRPSVTSRCYCIETTGRIELVFGMAASFYQSYTVV